MPGPPHRGERGANTADSVTALQVTAQAVSADPFDETAHRLLMRAEVAAGEPARALMVYERLRVALAAELGTDPAPETRAVHLAICVSNCPTRRVHPPGPRLWVIGCWRGAGPESTRSARCDACSAPATAGTRVRPPDERGCSRRPARNEQSTRPRWGA